jgi:CelD/BcsL family acetyltransferase involved in cellulose biosynthesis
MHAVEATRLCVRVEPLPSLLELERLWGELATAGNVSSFTSWHWIHCWLQELRSTGDYRLLRVSRGSRTIGAGILVITNVQRPNRLARRVVHLHATGDAECDSVHIEQNDIVCTEPANAEIYEAIIHCLMTGTERWDEIELRGVMHGELWLRAASDHQMLVEHTAVPAPRIIFDALPDGAPVWASVAERKVRYELRRALSDYGKLGTLRLDEPSSATDALQFLAELRALHDARWLSLQVHSYFSSPSVQRFHRLLVSTGFEDRSVRIFKVTAGTAVVGFVYVLIHDRVANFYQSGFDYQLLERHNQPGWVCLQLVLEALRAEGLRSFEFLSGNEAYKRRLATTVAMGDWLTLTRPFARFRLERAAVATVRSLRRAQR